MVYIRPLNRLDGHIGRSRSNVQNLFVNGGVQLFNHLRPPERVHPKGGTPVEQIVVRGNAVEHLAYLGFLGTGVAVRLNGIVVVCHTLWNERQDRRFQKKVKVVF